MNVSKKINQLEIAHRRLRKTYTAELWTEEQLRRLDENFEKMKSEILDQHLKL